MGRSQSKSAQAIGAATDARVEAAPLIPGIGQVGDSAAEWKPIEWVKRWDRNPRLNATSVPGVVESMRRFGFGAPLLCRSDGTLIAGDTRIQAAHVIGLPVVPVRVMDHLSPKEASALAIADNRLAERAKWNEPLLADLLRDVDETMRAATGFSHRESERLIAMLVDDQLRSGQGIADDVAPEASEALRRKWGVVLGDLWRVGASRILCGSATSEADVARLMAGETACLVNTDPPFGINYDEGARVKPRRVGRGDIANDELKGHKLQGFLEAFMGAALPYLTEEAAWYLWHPMLGEASSFHAAAQAHGIKAHRQIVWVKPVMLLTRSGMYHWKHEVGIYGWRKQPRWYGAKNQTTVWEIGRDSDKGMHPTQKPLELFTRPILNHTKAGDLCYEPFAGSGSQVLAAEVTGRRCYALDLDPRYVAVLLERATTRGFVCERLTKVVTGETQQ